jgi:Uma2 family endonuclease
MLMMNPELDKRTAQFLLEEFLSLDTPEGYRAQLIDGEIVVTPPPNGNHGRAIDHIVWQVFRKSAVEMSFDGVKGLIVPDGEIADAGRVIPDATFARRELDLFHNAPSWMEAKGVAMVVEVTSSRADRDRDAKRRAYAGAGIPLYLLVDRQFSRVTLFSKPAGDDYKRTLSVPCGTDLDLPEPFDFTLDTARFAD